MHFISRIYVCFMFYANLLLQSFLFLIPGQSSFLQVKQTFIVTFEIILLCTLLISPPVYNMQFLRFDFPRHLSGIGHFWSFTSTLHVFGFGFFFVFRRFKVLCIDSAGWVPHASHRSSIPCGGLSPRRLVGN